MNQDFKSNSESGYSIWVITYDNDQDGIRAKDWVGVFEILLEDAKRGNFDRIDKIELKKGY